MSSADSETPQSKGSPTEGKPSVDDAKKKGWDEEPSSPSTASAAPKLEPEQAPEPTAEEDQPSAEETKTKSTSANASRVKQQPSRHGRRLWLWVLLARGMETSEIAKVMLVSERTAKRMIASLLHKLGAANQIEAAALAGRHGLLDDPSRRTR